MNVLTFLYNIISGRTGKQRSIDNLLAQGNWRFIQLSNYTSAAPLSIAQGNTTKLTFQQSDISYTEGSDLLLSYDYALQKFTPQQLGDVFLVEVRMKVKCSSNNGHFDVLLDCPASSFGIVQSVTQGIPKAANTEQFVSLSVPVFIGSEVKANGLEVKVTAAVGNLSVYDVSYMIVRMTSGIPIAP